MKRLLKIVLGGMIAVGVLAIVVSVWAGQQIANMPPQAASAPAQTKSAHAEIREACAREVGPQGPDAVQRCEAEILGSQIDNSLKAQRSIESDAIARARGNLN